MNAGDLSDIVTAIVAVASLGLSIYNFAQYTQAFVYPGSRLLPHVRCGRLCRLQPFCNSEALEGFIENKNQRESALTCVQKICP